MKSVQPTVPTTAVQRKIRILTGEKKGKYVRKGANNTKALISRVEEIAEERGLNWKRGWKGWIGDTAADDNKKKVYLTIDNLR